MEIDLKWIILSPHKGGKIITKAHKVFLAEYEVQNVFDQDI
jgi:hypothetical protein